MMGKPYGDELIPVFMQDAMGFFSSLVVFFGLPAITTCFLMWHHQLIYTLFPLWYMYVVDSIFKNQNVFYLMQIVPAAAVRCFFRERLQEGGALMVAAFLFATAVLLVYPVESISSLRALRNIALFIMAPPLLMSFFILRIHRLSVSGGLVILFFVGLLCRGFFR